jgi:hypothetical protein
MFLRNDVAHKSPRCVTTQITADVFTAVRTSDIVTVSCVNDLTALVNEFQKHTMGYSTCESLCSYSTSTVVSEVGSGSLFQGLVG